MLLETINSFIMQDYENKEMIIVNDGSTSDYIKILDIVNMRDDIEYIVQKNRGIPSALNTGLKHSTGDLICEIQDDDLLFGEQSLSNRIEIFEKLNDFGIEVIWTSTQEIDEAGNNLKILEAIPVDYWLTVNHDEINTNSMMWKKSIHNKIGLFDEEILGNEDWFFKIKCLMRCNCISKNIITTKYRRWSGNRGTEWKANGLQEKYLKMFREKLRLMFDY